MNMKLIFPLVAACSLSFAGAVFAFTAGWGLLAAFAVYALGGAAMMIVFMALAFVPELFRTEPGLHRNFGWVADERRRAVHAHAHIVVRTSFPVA